MKIHSLWAVLEEGDFLLNCLEIKIKKQMILLQSAFRMAVKTVFSVFLRLKILVTAEFTVL